MGDAVSRERWMAHGRRVRRVESMRGRPHAMTRADALDTVLLALIGLLREVPEDDRGVAEAFAAEGYLAEHLQRGGTVTDA